jgi:HD-GYP domain-containing protein (c-di-GMP phosphodiesterase class II)
MSAFAQVFNLANPHALASIVNASATRKIVASQDIFDDGGTKLWARNQQVSQSLQLRLFERKLRHPLEMCLRAEDGVTSCDLNEALTTFLDSRHPLAKAIHPWADHLRTEIKCMPLHPSVQLLLTASHATKPQVFDHAVRGMALAGAMQASVNADQYEVRMAMLGGLLHDLGEMYLHPQYLDGSQPLDAPGYRHVVTHPRIGELLLATMTDYPAALGRAVGEHHERLDGNGYPMHRSREAMSHLGKLLSVVEVVLAITAAPTAPLTRASFALRMIPGEFDEAWCGFISQAAISAQEDVDSIVQGDAGNLLVHLALIDTDISMAREQAQTIAVHATASTLVREAASKASTLLHRLRLGWNSVGLWCASRVDGPPNGSFEISLAINELRYRMRSIERECLWQHTAIDLDEAAALEPLWENLRNRR